MSRLFSAEDFAQALGYPNVTAFGYARDRGLIPAPDGEANGVPYWLEDTVKATRKAHVDAIHAAWGYVGPNMPAGQQCAKEEEARGGYLH